nr:HNH endonuclease family protein [uncultured Rhodococcus sp.]
MSARRRLRIAVPIVMAVLAVGTYTVGTHADPLPRPAVAQTADTTAASTPVAISQLLAQLETVDSLADVDGYDRSCKKGSGCVFGPAWTDDSSAPGSHNGCDTRNDVLATQLIDVEFKPGTRDCKVAAGILHDPYTGSTIDDLGKIQIDHVYPLARAWNAGAWAWSIDQRTAFANDLDVNLLAVDGRTNQQKSDKGIDTWLPPNATYQCRYVTAYLTVAAKYDLDITSSDAQTAASVCSQ